MLQRAFYNRLVLLLLGFIFLPLATTVYAWEGKNGLPLAGINLLWLLIAVIIDLGDFGGSIASAVGDLTIGAEGWRAHRPVRDKRRMLHSGSSDRYDDQPPPLMTNDRAYTVNYEKAPNRRSQQSHLPEITYFRKRAHNLHGEIGGCDGLGRIVASSRYHASPSDPLWGLSTSFAQHIFDAGSHLSQEVLQHKRFSDIASCAEPLRTPHVRGRSR